MSFSSRVKEEIAAAHPLSACCRFAQGYGLMLFGRSFSAGDISLTTENAAVGQLYCQTLQSIAGVTARVSSTAKKKCSYYVGTRAERLRVLNAFGHDEDALTLRINRANLAQDCCFSAFLRGAFLACGAVGTPENSYHMEFSTPFKKLSLDLLNLLEEMELPPKYAERKSTYLIYFKNSEQIEDALTSMGAINASLEFMGAKMNKDMRNKVNRRVNFETANISRAVNAAMEQAAAIEKIEAAGGIRLLPENLRELAQARKEHPDATLAELSGMIGESLSRSGVHHRLARIVEFAENL